MRFESVAAAISRIERAKRIAAEKRETATHIERTYQAVIEPVVEPVVESSSLQSVAADGSWFLAFICTTFIVIWIVLRRAQTARRVRHRDELCMTKDYFDSITSAAASVHDLNSACAFFDDKLVHASPPQFNEFWSTDSEELKQPVARANTAVSHSLHIFSSALADRSRRVYRHEDVDICSFNAITTAAILRAAIASRLWDTFRLAAPAVAETGATFELLIACERDLVSHIGHIAASIDTGLGLLTCGCPPNSTKYCTDTAVALRSSFASHSRIGDTSDVKDSLIGDPGRPFRFESIDVQRSRIALSLEILARARAFGLCGQLSHVNVTTAHAQVADPLQNHVDACATAVDIARKAVPIHSRIHDALSEADATCDIVRQICASGASWLSSRGHGSELNGDSAADCRAITDATTSATAVCCSIDKMGCGVDGQDGRTICQGCVAPSHSLKCDMMTVGHVISTRKDSVVSSAVTAERRASIDHPELHVRRVHAAASRLRDASNCLYDAPEGSEQSRILDLLPPDLLERVSTALRRLGRYEEALSAKAQAQHDADDTATSTGATFADSGAPLRAITFGDGDSGDVIDDVDDLLPLDRVTRDATALVSVQRIVGRASLKPDTSPVTPRGVRRMGGSVHESSSSPALASSDGIVRALIGKHGEVAGALLAATLMSHQLDLRRDAQKAQRAAEASLAAAVREDAHMARREAREDAAAARTDANAAAARDALRASADVSARAQRAATRVEAEAIMAAAASKHADDALAAAESSSVQWLANERASVLVSALCSAGIAVVIVLLLLSDVPQFGLDALLRRHIPWYSVSCSVAESAQYHTPLWAISALGLKSTFCAAAQVVLLVALLGAIFALGNAWVVIPRALSLSAAVMGAISVIAVFERPLLEDIAQAAVMLVLAHIAVHVLAVVVFRPTLPTRQQLIIDETARMRVVLAAVSDDTETDASSEVGGGSRAHKDKKCARLLFRETIVAALQLRPKAALLVVRAAVTVAVGMTAGAHVASIDTAAAVHLVSNILFQMLPSRSASN